MAVPKNFRMSIGNSEELIRKSPTHGVAVTVQIYSLPILKIITLVSPSFAGFRRFEAPDSGGPLTPGRYGDTNRVKNVSYPITL